MNRENRTKYFIAISVVAVLIGVLTVVKVWSFDADESESLFRFEFVLPGVLFFLYALIIGICHYDDEGKEE